LTKYPTKRENHTELKFAKIEMMNRGIVLKKQISTKNKEPTNLLPMSSEVDLLKFAHIYGKFSIYP
jgi:hypothetical protein